MPDDSHIAWSDSSSWSCIRYKFTGKVRARPSGFEKDKRVIVDFGEDLSVYLNPADAARLVDEIGEIMKGTAHA